MNGTLPRIEIIAPFKAAFEWMKVVLFRPFDVAKWLTIAFAAFIAANFGGGFNFGPGNWSQGDWKYRMSRNGDFTIDPKVAPWIIVTAVVAILIVVIIAIVWAWVSARGRFIFTDCVVKNRAAIGEPWREYRREGNSFFLFWLAIGASALLLVAILTLIVIGLFQIGNLRDTEAGFAPFVVLIGMAVIWVGIGVILAVVSHFMVPVMYRRGCRAREAFVDVAKLIVANPGPFILFVLFKIALVLAVAIVGTMVACLTCCIGGLPYISTVLLLPAVVWLEAYRLLFLRQFGDQYDVWSTAAAPSTLPPSPAPPA